MVHKCAQHFIIADGKVKLILIAVGTAGYSNL